VNYYLRVLSTANDLYEERGDTITKGLALFNFKRVNIGREQNWASEHVQNDDAA